MFKILEQILKSIIRKIHRRLEIYQVTKKINHFLYMNDIKIFAKNEKELETLLQTIRIIKD